MEIEVDVEKVFNDINFEKVSSKLDKILNAVDGKMLNEALNDKYKGTVFGDIYRTSTEIKSRLKALDESISTIAYQELVESTALSNYYFRKAFIEKDKIAVFKFLIINHYFKFPVNMFFSKNSITSENVSFVVDYLAEILNTSSSVTMIPENASYYEKKWVVDFIEGKRIGDLEKVYEYVYAVERGRSFLAGILFDDLILLLFDLDRFKYYECLNKKEGIVDFILFLQNLGRKRLIILAASFNFSNKWLIFEMIRQIIEHEKSNKVDLVGETVIKKLISELFQSDKLFVIQVIKHLENSFAVSGALGLWLPGLTGATRNTIIDQCFKFDNTGRNIDLKNNLLQNYDRVALEADTRLFLQDIFVRLDNYTASLLSPESDFYAYKILRNDFMDYIVICYKGCFTLRQISEEINKCLDEIQYLESNWYKDSTKYNTAFFIHFTKLYLLCLAFKDISQEEKQSMNFPSIDAVLKNPILIQRFFRKDGKVELKDIYSILTTQY